MDNGLAVKSEPPVAQDAGASGPPLRRVSSDETERPPSAQPIPYDSDEQVSASFEEEENSGPSERIVDFDWDDLHERYHEAVNKCQGQETELLKEWESLMTYFRIWASSGHDRETGRTYSRLRTRMTYVQNSEEKLERTRNHYINVVKAFESAIYLAYHPTQMPVQERSISTSDVTSPVHRLVHSSCSPTCASSKMHVMRCAMM